MTARQDFPEDKFPFSDQLCLFIDDNPDFFNSLKLANSKFVLILVLGITRTPDNHPLHNDEIIGMFYCDTTNYHSGRRPFFKQDYIVNEGSTGNSFVSYSASNNNGTNVRPIDEFFTKYGSNGQFYHRGGNKPWEHHYDDVLDLPDYSGLRLAASALLSSI